MKRERDPSRAGSWFGKPYHSFSDYLRNKYNCRVLKIPINAGLSCPNRDGTAGRDGCIFCSADGSASPGMTPGSPIGEQMDLAKKAFKRSDKSTRYIAYFQAFTNTYGPPSLLKGLYDRAVGRDDVVGIMIGTRPDCVPDETLDIIASYLRPGFEVWLEIGMQSSHDKSLEFLRRGHINDVTVDAVRRAALRGIPVCVHLILGIPGESWQDMMATAAALRALPVRGIKFHHLHVISGTTLEGMFRAGLMKPLSMNEYVSAVCDFIERVSPDILIHRLMGDREENTLVAPRWGLHKGTVIKAIEDEFLRRGSFQGILYDSGW
ncbi:MAG TPA: TIGR01212 family radical SAM protein [Spirochaetota bacterium]|nr:TIGR01212 family radical SAM protein [Spirochaetota bacterium]HPC40810.1 TIGR01212 family radical SAM protein [Spirochaetota bacterium]HPL15741.1 TIGR01212 family radical SAM protein [Spirochaetota bacterium]HQJ70640.1 TIGR01212 family radical SAM protein [Spirochaetota bacterium]HRS78861.1 TIGR01212 family radical SAM protein [Spirochaetota bacterium]